MNTNVSKINQHDIIKALLLTVYISVCASSIKTAYDLAKYSSVFPVWFVPSFILGIVGLIVVCLYLIFNAMKVKAPSQLLTGRLPISLWVSMSLSFICTTAVHNFYPFRPDTYTFFPSLDSVLKVNFTIAMSGFLISVMLAVLYLFTQNKPSAIVGLLVLALLILIPNDNCSNPFNYWWIEKIGASPLMYVPNSYTAMFVACGLLGVHSKGVTLLSFGTCLGSLFLGIGHLLKIIW